MPTRCAKQILRVLTLLACAYFALWACAPPSVVAPLVPFDPDNPTSLGGALVASADSSPLWRREGQYGLAGGVSFWVEQTKPRFDRLASLSVSVAGTERGASAGVGLRWRAVTNDRLLFGLQSEIGFVYATFSTPLSVRLGRDTWLYTAPQVGAHLDSFLQFPLGSLLFPLGVSIPVVERTRVHLEAGWQPLIDLGYFDGRLPFYVAAGLTWRPARPSRTSPASP